MELDKILELTTKTRTQSHQKHNPIPSPPNLIPYPSIRIPNPSIRIPNPYKTHSLTKTIPHLADPHPKITRITKTFNKFNQI